MLKLILVCTDSTLLSRKVLVMFLSLPPDDQAQHSVEFQKRFGDAHARRVCGHFIVVPIFPISDSNGLGGERAEKCHVARGQKIVRSLPGSRPRAFFFLFNKRKSECI